VRLQFSFEDIEVVDANLEFIMDCTLVAIKEPSDWRPASTITSIPFAIALMLVPSKTVEELVMNVKVWAASIEVIVKELPDTLATDPIICWIPPFAGSMAFPDP
jgi:hypothetical protein